MKFVKFILTVFSLCFYSATIYSVDEPFFLGISAGQTSVNKNVEGNYDVATTATFTLGVVLSESLSYQTFAEGSYTQTLAKENVTINSIANEYKGETLGLFLSAKTKSDLYLKAKLGLVDHKITTNDLVTYDKTKLAAGIGFGITNDSGGITEIEYVVYENDVSFLNIGYLF